MIGGRGSKKRKSKPNRVKQQGETRESGRGNLKAKLALAAAETAKKIFQFASLIKSVPFEVDPSAGKGRLRARLFRKWWQRWLWYIPNVVIYACSIYQAYSFHQVIVAQGLSSEFAMHTTYIFVYMVGVLYFGTMLVNGSTFVKVINGLDSLMELSKDWSGSHRWYQSLFAVISINYFAMIMGAAAPVLIGVYFLVPTHSRYLYSTLPTDLQNVPVLIGGGIMETTIYIWFAGNVVVYYCYWCMIVFQKLFWLEGLCDLVEAAGTSYDHWRSIITFYRSLKCLNILHNEFSRHFSLGFTIIISFVEVLCLYCSLRAYDLLPALFYPLFPLFSVFIFFLIVALYPYIARWEQRSGDFMALSMAKLKPLRRRGEDYESLYKDLRSLMPICNELSHFSTNSFETSQGMADQIIDNLLLLLTL